MLEINFSNGQNFGDVLNSAGGIYRFLDIAQRVGVDEAFYLADAFKDLYGLEGQTIYARLVVLFSIRGLEMSIGIDVQGPGI